MRVIVAHPVARPVRPGVGEPLGEFASLSVHGCEDQPLITMSVDRDRLICAPNGVSNVAQID
jgi:hypothetical protein